MIQRIYRHYSRSKAMWLTIILLALLLALPISAAIASSFFAGKVDATTPSQPSSVALTTTPTFTSTPTATTCPQATPEALWVEPVTSPTAVLQQTITVRIGNGEAVTITSESGVYAVTGNFNTTNNPAQVTIPLLPDTTHHLTVIAKVRRQTNGCNYGGYTLSTQRDRNGSLLVVEQQTGTATPVPPTVTPTPTNTPVPLASVMLSSDANGSVPGLSFRDEDMIAYNPNTGLWSLLFDGSDVGLGNVDVDGFAFLPGPGGTPNLLLSVEKDFTLSGFGAVDDSDILKFIPSSYGANTAGSYVAYFDGSDVGLEKSDEDVDAIDFDASGNLLISVDGAFNAQGVKGNDEDLFVLTGFTPGANTSGTWVLYFDGSDVKLTSSDEDIFSLWADHAHSKLYLTTRGNFSVTGVSGDKDDIFVCNYTSLGANTACTFSLFWNGDNFGFDDDAIDGLSIGTPPSVISAAEINGSVAVDDTLEVVGDDANEADPLDGAETMDEAVQNNRLFLPVVQN